MTSRQERSEDEQTHQDDQVLEMSDEFYDDEAKIKEIEPKIEEDDQMEHTWDMEEQIPPISSWRRRFANPKSEEEEALRFQIHALYEEMYMVQDWNSLGGLITHYPRVDFRWKHQLTPTGFRYDKLQDGLAKFSGLSEEDFEQLIWDFKKDYQDAAKDVIAMINEYPPVAQESRQQYLSKLQAIRKNPRYVIFFKSHFAETYEKKFKKLGLME